MGAFNTKDWMAGETVTAAMMDLYVADNFVALMPTASTITTTGTQIALTTPTGRGDLVIYCNNASLLTLQGITAGFEGQQLRLISIGAGQVDLVHQSGSASAANRIINAATSGNTSLAAGKGYAVLTYDDTNDRWRLTEHCQGAYITTAFSAGDYTASSGTWTVDAGDAVTIQYYLTAKTNHVMFRITGTDVSATPTKLNILNGAWGSFTTTKAVSNPCVVNDAAGGELFGTCEVAASDTKIQIGRSGGAAWSTTSSDNTTVAGEIRFEVT